MDWRQTGCSCCCLFKLVRMAYAAEGCRKYSAANMRCIFILMRRNLWTHILHYITRVLVFIKHLVGEVVINYLISNHLISYHNECEHSSGIMLCWWLWIRAQLWHHATLMIVNTSTALVSCYADDCEYEHSSDIMLHWWLWIRAHLWHHATLMIVNTSTALTSCFTDDCEYKHSSGIMLHWWLWIRAQIWHHATTLMAQSTLDCLIYILRLL